MKMSATSVCLPCKLSLMSFAAFWHNCGSLPSLHELQVNVLHLMSPGGLTRCADGSDFSFLVRPGSSNNVIIEFQGGGCWNKGGCDASTSNHRVYDEVKLLNGMASSFATDIPILADPLLFGSQVSVTDWTYIYVPYCTQDMHLGTRSVEYSDAQSGETLLMHHWGAANTDAVISWVYRNMPSPGTFALVGCSAGAMGVLALEAARADRHYAGVNTKIVNIGDSPGLLPTTQFVQNGIRNWGIECVVAEALNVTLSAKSNADLVWNLWLWDLALMEHPAVSFGYYTSTEDAIQQIVWRFLGGTDGADPIADTFKVKRHILNVAERLQTHSNFNSFVAVGNGHCTSTFDVASSNANFSKWAGSLLMHEFPGAWDCGADCRLSGMMGCDGIQGSKMIEDYCNSCGGDGQTCSNNVQMFRCSTTITTDTTTAIVSAGMMAANSIRNTGRSWFVALWVFWVSMAQRRSVAMIP